MVPLRAGLARTQIATVMMAATGAATSPHVTLECPPAKADPFRDALDLVTPPRSNLRFGKAYGEQGEHGARKDRARRRARQKRRRAGR